MFKLLSVFVVIISSFSALAVEKPSTNIESCGTALSYKLAECQSYVCNTTTESFESYAPAQVSNQIIGLDDDGKCLYVQKIDDGRTVTCHYSQDSRKFMSLKMDNAQKQGDTYQPTEMDLNLAQEIFANECKLEFHEKM